MKLLKSLKYLAEYIKVGDWKAARQELRNELHLAIWWNYRCVQAWEIHYPARDGRPKRTLEFYPDDDEALADTIRKYLYPGCDVKIYIRYVSGKRKRIRLR